MRSFWKKYVSNTTNMSMEDRKEFLRELQFNEYIHPDYMDAFLAYLNDTLSQLIMYYEEQKTISFKQGELLKANMKQMDQKKYAETDSIDGKNSGDAEGLEESFADITQRNIREEFEAVYGEVEEE